ncbi:MAG: hypothetical protein JJU24_16595 [Natronohydrobacter sp.]|nr:hypothetical protein [Natronohydrobacter sp.]
MSDSLPSIAVAGISRVGKSSLAEHFRQRGYSVIPTDGLRRFYWSKEQGHSFVNDVKECRRAFYTQCYDSAPTGICLEGDDFWHYAATRYKEQTRETGFNGRLRSWDRDIRAPLILLGIQEKDIQRKAEQIRQYAEENGDLENQDFSVALNKATKIAAARPLMCKIADTTDNVIYFDTFSGDDPVKRIKNIFLEACEAFGVGNPR